MSDYATAELPALTRLIISWPCPALCTLTDYLSSALTPWLVFSGWFLICIPTLWLQALDSWLFKFNAKHLSTIISPPSSPSLSFSSSPSSSQHLEPCACLCQSVSLSLMKAGKLSKMMNWQNSWSRLSSQLGPGRFWLAECNTGAGLELQFSLPSQFNIQLENYRWLQFTETSVGRIIMIFMILTAGRTFYTL